MGGSERKERTRSLLSRIFVRVKRVRVPKLFAYLHADSVPWHSWSLVRSVIMRYQPVIYSRLRVLLKGSRLSSRSSAFFPFSRLLPSISKNGVRTGGTFLASLNPPGSRRSPIAFILFPSLSFLLFLFYSSCSFVFTFRLSLLVSLFCSSLILVPARLW